MPTEKLTTKCIEGIKPPAADRVDYFDAILPGLSLRVTRAGAIRRAFAGQGFDCLALRRFRVFPNRPAFESLAALEAGLEGSWLAPLGTTHFNYLGRKAA